MPRTKGNIQIYVNCIMVQFTKDLLTKSQSSCASWCEAGVALFLSSWMQSHMAHASAGHLDERNRTGNNACKSLHISDILVRGGGTGPLLRSSVHFVLYKSLSCTRLARWKETDMSGQSSLPLRSFSLLGFLVQAQNFPTKLHNHVLFPGSCGIV